MPLKDIKTLLGIDDESQDELLTLLSKNAERQLLARLQNDKEVVASIPPALEYIIPELTVIRYNRMGAEGIESESVEGYSANYGADDFKPYQVDINLYLGSLGVVKKKGTVTFY